MHHNATSTAQFLLILSGCGLTQLPNASEFRPWPVAAPGADSADLLFSDLFSDGTGLKRSPKNTHPNNRSTPKQLNKHPTKATQTTLQRPRDRSESIPFFFPWPGLGPLEPLWRLFTLEGALWTLWGLPSAGLNEPCQVVFDFVCFSIWTSSPSLVYASLDKAVSWKTIGPFVAGFSF